MQPFYKCILHMCFKLYPDCKLVKGIIRDAIYDLTRNSIYIVPHSMATCVSEDNVVCTDNLPIEQQREFVNFLLENELGRFNMPEEIVQLNDEYINPSAISNAIIDIGENELPLHKISMELSEMVCESVFLRFINKVSFDYIINCSKNFMSYSMSSIEIGMQYEDGIEECIDILISQIPMCTRMLIVHAPFTKTEVTASGIPIRFVKKDFSCRDNRKYNISGFANVNFDLYFESLKYNNCLNGKIAIDQHGYIKNCPESTKRFGNVDNISLLEVVENQEFRKSWEINKDHVEKCRDCELRYACQNCVFLTMNVVIMFIKTDYDSFVKF